MACLGIGEDRYMSEHSASKAHVSFKCRFYN